MLSAELRSRVIAYSATKRLTYPAALCHLVSVGLQSVEARAKGAGVVNAISLEDRQARARKAAAARWGRLTHMDAAEITSAAGGRPVPPDGA